MEKYILELIKENNRVIIPNFGAFIISKENGISILFNNFLSFNDGLLVNYVADKKGIDTIVATDQVFDFVDSLKKQLDEQGVYTIEKLGVFKKDDNGILRFQQASDFGDIAESEPENTSNETPANHEKEDTSEDEKESILLDIDDTSEIIDTPEEEKVKEEDSIELEKIDEPILTIDKESTEEKNIENQETEEKIVTSEPQVEKHTEKIISSTATTSKKDVNKYAQKETNKKKRKDILTIVVIALLVILCVAVYFVFFNKKKEVVKTIPVKVEKPAKTEQKQIDSVKVIKEVIKEKAAISKPEVKPQKIVSNDFYIVVGSFKQQENAIKMVDKLKASGFSNAQVITKGNMYLVSADSNPSYKVIEARQQEILEKDRMESWLYKVQ